MPGKADPKPLLAAMNRMFDAWQAVGAELADANTWCKPAKGARVVDHLILCGSSMTNLGKLVSRFGSAIKDVETQLKAFDKKSALFKTVSPGLALAKKRHKDFEAEWQKHYDAWKSFRKKLEKIQFK